MKRKKPRAAPHQAFQPNYRYPLPVIRLPPLIRVNIDLLTLGKRPTVERSAKTFLLRHPIKPFKPFKPFQAFSSFFNPFPISVLYPI